MKYLILILFSSSVYSATSLNDLYQKQETMDISPVYIKSPDGQEYVTVCNDKELLQKTAAGVCKSLGYSRLVNHYSHDYGDVMVHCAKANVENGMISYEMSSSSHVLRFIRCAK